MKYRLSVLLLMLATFVSAAPAAQVALEEGDHICLVGNALGERLQHQNDWETLLHVRFPQLNLTVRNLCFPGDEPFERIRSLDFGDPDKHLTHSQASVIFFFFGMAQQHRSSMLSPW